MASASEQWLAKVSAFRRSPSQFFSDYGTSAESFLLDVLEALCREGISEHSKLQLLFLLQEKGGVILDDATSVECAVGSLKDMFLHPPGHVSQLYQSQILVTTVVVIVTSDLLEKHQEVFVEFVGVLLDLVDKVNSSANILVRKAACECLWELEMSYPGLLQAKLDHLYAKCAAEASPIFQSYMLLFVTALHHAIEHLVRNAAEGLPDNCVNDLLTTRTEPFKPLYLPTKVAKDTFPVEIHANLTGIPQHCLPANVDSRELRRALSFLMDNISLLNTSGLVHTIRQLMHCVKLAELPPNAFKSQFIHWVSTTDIAVFHLLLLLKLKFSREMFEEHDELLLLQRLLLQTDQPTLPHGHRLLCYDWLMHFPDDQCKSGRSPVESCLPLYLDYSQFVYFYPLVFDSTDTIQVKLKALCLCYEPSEQPDVASSSLMGALSLLHKPVQHGIGGRYVSSLFRVLFCYYQRHWNTALVQEIYKLVLAIVMEHPKFMPHAVDFLDAVAPLTPESSFTIDLLLALSKHIVSQPVAVILPNIAHHLKLLAQVMRHTSISPTSTINYLGQILVHPDSASRGDWQIGNCVLAVCHSILLHHDSAKIIKDLGDLLLQICMTYQETDVRDRARFYYSLLTNVSSEKCSKILASETQRKEQLPHVIADDITSTSFPVALPVQHLKKPFLALTRIPRPTTPEADVPRTISRPSGHIDELELRGLLQKYLRMVSEASIDSEIKIDCYLHCTANLFNCEFILQSRSVSQEVPSRVYALVLQFRTDRGYGPLPDIHIPYLSTTTSDAPGEGCQQVTVSFRPLEPVPAVFNVRALFHNDEGLTCAMNLEPLAVNFADMFVPLRPPLLQTKDEQKLCLAKGKLYTKLLDYIRRHLRTGDSPSESAAESVVCLNVDWCNMGKLIRSHLQLLLVSSSEEESIVGIFLPPRQHLLLEFRPMNGKTVVTMATDDWRILGLASSYLKQFEERKLQ